MNHKKTFLPFLILFLPIILCAQKDSILVKEASFRYEYQEFELEKVNQKYLARASFTGNYDPSQFAVATESVLIEPARIKYIITEPVYKKVMVEEEKNGKNITYEKEILVEKATIEKIEIPAKYGVITKAVFCCPDGGYRGEGTVAADLKRTPAKYRTFETWVVKRESTVEKVEISAVYKMIE